ncbi:hypothetical protein D3C78_505200 [compost metagenome]
MAPSHSRARAKRGWLTTSTRAACSQPRMISASPPSASRLTRLANQSGTLSGISPRSRSAITLPSAIRTTRMLEK